MSVYHGKNSRPEYRRGYGDFEKQCRGENNRERDQVRRKGEPTRGSPGSGERMSRSPQASHRSRSPPRAPSRHNLLSGARRPVSPSNLGSRVTTSAETRNPKSLASKPTHANDEPISDRRTSTLTSVTARPPTRDPRLLQRINTSSSAAAGNNTSASVAGSPSILASATSAVTDRGNDPTGLPVSQRSEQIPATPGGNPSPSTSRAASEPQQDPSSRLVTLLSSLFENSSESAALSYEHKMLKAKAANQVNVDRKMIDFSKTFPAFAETSTKAKKDTEKDLALLEKKQSEHLKARVDLLSAVSDILQASRTPNSPKNQREQLELIHRCMSLYEDFKANIDSLKQRFEEDKLVTSKLEQGHLGMEEKIDSSTTQVTDLSSQMAAVQLRCSALEGKHAEAQDRYSTLEGKYIEVQDRCSTLEGKHAEFQDRCSTLEGKYDEVQDRCSTLEGKYDEVQDRCSTLEGKYDAVQDRYSTLEGKYAEVQDRYSTLEGKHAEVQDRFSTLEGKHDEVQDRYSTLEGKYAEVQDRYSTLEGKYAEVQDRYSTLEGKYDAVQDVIKSSSDEMKSSVATLQINLKQCSEKAQKSEDSINAATDAVEKLWQRLDLLESQFQASSNSEIVRARKVGELEKLADDHSNELQRIKVTASNTKALHDTFTVINQEAQDLHQTLADARNKKHWASPFIQALSGMKGDIESFSADLQEIKKQTTNVQSSSQTGQNLFPTIRSDDFSGLEGDTNSKDSSRLSECERRLHGFFEDIKNIQQKFEQKQREEDERDDFVAAQIEEVKASIAEVKAELQRHIDDLERDVQQQLAEHDSRIQKLEDSIAQLVRSGNQVSTPRTAPPSAPPTPQMHHTLQPQATSSSQQPLVPIISAELSRRLHNAEFTLSATGQQLQALRLAYQQLDQRYNNLCTEPIVRAMVRQMQLMYPYASEAQRDIFNLRQSIEPLLCIPAELEKLKTVVQNRIDRLLGIQKKVEILEKERRENDSKHRKLVEHVKQERGKLMEEVSNQKKDVSGLVNRLHRLEGHHKAEADKLEHLTETWSSKLQAEYTKKFEEIAHRLDVFDQECKRQYLLHTFSGRCSGQRTADSVGDLAVDATDDSSVTHAVKTKGLEAQSEPSSVAPGVSKTFLKPKTDSKPRKRKRLGSMENNECSDDETFSTKTEISPNRRRYT